ncbi:MAG: nucleotidyl transferase [Desulfobacteraceae bacterium]|nr:MAG: nucleotidyl transferase [Desulfobacteraceae bacterium]
MRIVIMAGGAGIRFWPASRKKRPKQFLNISGPQPMLLETIERVKPLAGDEDILVVLGREHLAEAQKLLPERKVHLLAEPRSRNTAPCIGLAAVYASVLKWEDPLAFLPADHFIARPAVFLESLKRAAEAAATGAIVTLGIVPTWPAVGYGYIQKTDEYHNSPGREIFQVKRFIEKPDLPRAQEYIRSPDFFWNAGIFIATPATILNAMEDCLPALFKELKKLVASIGSGAFEKTLMEFYQKIPSISFDYGVMERTNLPVFVLPCDCGWSDVGSWASLYALKASQYDAHRNLLEGQVVVIDSRNNYIANQSDRLVACLGLEHCLIVDTPESLLVMDLDRTQEIRKIIEQIEKIGKEDKL